MILEDVLLLFHQTMKKQFDFLRICGLFIIFAPKIITKMVVTFNEDYLEKLYSKGETGTKKIWFQPQIVRGYQKGIKYLIQAKRKEDLYPFKSLHFEALHGDKEGRYSIKANDQYRIEFTLEESDEEPIVTICNIMELSNHYK
jgi:proteic killer suppression protein